MAAQRILAVDDNDASRHSVIRMLQHAGFKIQHASNGENALKLAQEIPDLIILEVHMPDMDGFEVCRRLKSDPRTASIPVVFISHTVERAGEVVDELGVEAFLTHPLTSDELVTTISGILHRKRRTGT